MNKRNILLWIIITLAITALAAPMAMAAAAPHYFSVPNYANSPAPINGSGGIRKFIDGLPKLTPAGANNLNQYIPVAVADTTTYPGSDYYEIGVVQYREKMHSDLPATLLRGYVQLSTSVTPGARRSLTNANLDGTTTPVRLNGEQVYGVDNPHYLGPLISATKDKPVRILFRNLLPAGVDGNLFIPVDTTVMGAGMGPGMMGMAEMDPQNPMCGNTPKPLDCFTENRATLHLHGGISPWISDGTPHQWVTPADENTPYPQGVSVKNVPDMPDPGPGAITFFYTNQQSARLMFYHDHAWGITRLNVYAGEAAAYVISDPVEQALVSQGSIPGAADTIPLVIQDKTFVPTPAELALQDPGWDTAKWGGLGNLWVPHVYVPAQNPGDSSGVNQFGRWAYGPWFWPPTSNIDYPPVANPYFDPACDSDLTWCEPPMMPGVPFISMGMEAFNDTPVVNGTVYPTVTVDPKSYRLRILNAANDRFWNLSLYKADATGKEVALNPAEVAAALDDTTIFPTPIAGNEGPAWIQIGTEGGFLPAPVVIPAQYTTWVTDPTVFNAGNVDKHSLLLGPAERADVIVDFSQFAGQTLILYNDAPAAFPARDPRYDYYTGNADLRDTGGADTTLPGYGPNTRTIMQIKVAAAPAASAFNLNGLNAAFAHQLDAAGKSVGVFESSQHPIIVGQGAYNSAYGTTFRNTSPFDGFARITDFSLNFKTLLGGSGGASMTIPFRSKAIQDEMGEAFDNEYGRMSGNLGLEVPLTQAGTQQKLILYPYVNPSSELLDGIELPPGVSVTPISSADDGTQIWKITHNGVDTHPIHFHLFDVQILNRVGWDGIIRKPEPNELGWKDTVRISPLEDTIVAFRPFIPKIPFGVPDSIRPLNPMMPLGSTAMFNNTDALGNPISPVISNILTNFGWEYVWHCHILSHEEMDMMRPMSVSVARSMPVVTSLNATVTGPVNLNWTDGTPVTTDPATWGSPSNEIGFRIERATGATGTFASIGQALANITNYSDTTAVSGSTYMYQVIAYNAAGEATSNIVTATVTVPTAPAAPGNLIATVQAGPAVGLTWMDNATNETGFEIERSVNGGAFIQIATNGARTGTGSVSYTDITVSAGNSYVYRVRAMNGATLASAYSNTATVLIPGVVNVTTVAPVSGSIAGGTAVTISGTNFVAGATVSFGGTAATNINVVSSTSITATTPAHAAGPVAVAVTNPDGASATLANGYTYTTAAIGTYSLFPANAVPIVAADADTSSVELGMKFTSTTAGQVTGVRYYKSTANTGTHTGSLWSGNGTLLARVTFTGESASGWQQADFTAPVAIAANTTYVISYHANVGRYSVNENYFTTARTNGPLTAPANIAGSPNGVYAYGANPAFPTLGWNSSNYWVDVVFDTP